MYRMRDRWYLQYNPIQRLLIAIVILYPFLGFVDNIGTPINFFMSCVMELGVLVYLWVEFKRIRKEIGNYAIKFFDIDKEHIPS